MADETLDALGHPIVLGQLYGYSNRANAFTSVIIGTAIRITEGDRPRIALEVIHAGRAVYSSPVKDSSSFRKIAYVYANSLFPLESADVYWEKE